jgi:RNA polymerase sigma factor for flagellar operon FliA
MVHFSSSPIPADSPADSFVDQHLSLIKAIAISIHRKLPRHVELDDLVQAGAVGLLDARAKYKPEKNVPFALYAKFRIRGAILDSLRQLDALSRDARRKQKLQTRVLEQASCIGGDNSMTEMPCPATPMSYLVARTDTHTTGYAGALDRAIDPQAPADSSPEEICRRRELRGLLLGVRGLLPPRYQQLISLYYDAGLTMKQVATAMGVNESRISQMHQVALQRMASTMQHSGIEGSHLMYMR